MYIISLMEQTIIDKIKNNLFEYKEQIIATALSIGIYNLIRKIKKIKQQKQFLKAQSKLLRKKSRLRDQFKYNQYYIIPPQIINSQNSLLDELRQLNSPACMIQSVPHLLNELRIVDIPNILSPLSGTNKYRNIFGGQGFLSAESFVYQGSYILNTSTFSNATEIKNQKQWLTSGPRKHLYFQPEKVKAAIVTCGGLCPGLNVVIRQIYLTLKIQYCVEEIWGIKYGFEGFYKHQWIPLTMANVRTIHFTGGTVLGSSRGGFDIDKILNAIQTRGINQIYIIGGDGTHKGIYKLCKQISIRKLEVSCLGVPKTIDNDIPIIDKSFGFQTAVSESIRAIRSAYVQSIGADYGIGLVRLMGRDAGWIAMQATNASRDVNICLIPEFQFDLYGKCGLLQYIHQQLIKNRHLVIVVAQGIGEAVRDNFGQQLDMKDARDKTGNKKLPDIGAFLKTKIVSYSKTKGVEVTLKYIDPTYMIRTVPANAYDKKMCCHLASSAVHGAMAGFTNFTVGHINNAVAIIPIQAIYGKKNLVTKDYRGWQRVLAGTGQPFFLNPIQNHIIIK